MSSPAKGLHIGLWVVQVLLGVAFFGAGLPKATAPIAELAVNMPWAADMPTLTRFIGVSELLGAAGLIVPAATRIKTWLTPLAAALLALVMVLAAGYHVLHSEFSMLVPNFVLGGLAVFVAWGRFKRAPIASR